MAINRTFINELSPKEEPSPNDLFVFGESTTDDGYSLPIKEIGSDKQYAYDCSFSAYNPSPIVLTPPHEQQFSMTSFNYNYGGCYNTTGSYFEFPAAGVYRFNFIFTLNITSSVASVTTFYVRIENDSTTPTFITGVWSVVPVFPIGVIGTSAFEFGVYVYFPAGGPTPRAQITFSYDGSSSVTITENSTFSGFRIT